MRTTLTLDEGIARALKERAHRSGKPFKQVVNETLRAGLTASGTRPSKPYKVKPAALGGVLPGINLDKALALADAIEDQELAAKMQLRK
jgi:plasmid stability protein